MIRFDCYLFADFLGGDLERSIISVTWYDKVTLFSCDDESISHAYWNSVQVKPDEVFQLMDYSTECRIVKIIPSKKKFTLTKRANSYTARAMPALAKVTSGVLAIAGKIGGSLTWLSTVSSYHIAGDTW